MRLPAFLTRARELADERHMELMENDARIAALLFDVRDRLDRLPEHIADVVVQSAVADVLARAQVRADSEAQPLSIQAADKQRVQEARERERGQR